MKNLTVKKIALGLFLAGYAASSAFALTATTSGVINGNKPVMKSYAASAAEHTMTAKILDPVTGNPITRAAKVGDTISISYKLEDKDKDTDENLSLHKTLKVFTKATRNTPVGGTPAPWVDRTADITVTATAVSGNDDEEGEFHFVIPDSFAGVEVIGYKLQERTDYGVPYEGEWLTVSDIWDRTNPPGHGDTEPTDPGTDPAGPGDGTGTGTGPVESDATKIGIFKITSGSIDRTVNYTAATAPAPKYGEQFVAIVWDEAGTPNGIPDGTETERTSSYTFKWKLTGTYTPSASLNSSNPAHAAVGAGPADANGVPTSAEITTTLGVDSLTGVHDRIQLGLALPASGKHNTQYHDFNNDYIAGAQGYNLTVTTD